MPMTTALWTVLPNGAIARDGGWRLRLSVHVSLRLAPAAETGTLSEFERLLDWPATLRTTQPPGEPWRFKTRAGSAHTAAVVSTAPDSELWRRLFKPAMPVRRHAGDDLTGRPLNSYPASAVLGELRRAYQRISAQSPVALPRPAAAHSAFAALGSAFGAPDPGVPVPPPAAAIQADATLTPTQRRARLAERQQYLAENYFRPVPGVSAAEAQRERSRIATALAQSNPAAPVLVVPVSSATSPFAALESFHHRTALTGERPPAGAGADPILQGEFHDTLTLLGLHPFLLRQLGLVVDLELPLEGLADAPLGTTPGALSFEPAGVAAVVYSSVCPATVYSLEPPRLFVAGATNQTQPENHRRLPEPRPAGRLRGRPSRCRQPRTQGDQLGGHAGDRASPAAGDPDATQGGIDASTGIPGIAVQRNRNAEVLWHDFVRSRDQNGRLGDAPESITLYAEDVVRGWRFDVLDATAAPSDIVNARWHRRTSESGIIVWIATPVKFWMRDSLRYR